MVYHSKKFDKIASAFLGLVALNDSKDQFTVDVVEMCSTQLGNLFSRTVGTLTDNACAMVGVNNKAHHSTLTTPGSFLVPPQNCCLE